MRFTGAGRQHEARAAREVIPAAGAVNTPQLLELSGIGQPERLRALGIAVRRALPGVGENLQDLQLRTVVKVDGVRTLNTQVAHWWGKLGIGLQYVVNQSGPMSMAPSQLGAFARSDPGRAPQSRISRAAALARQVRRAAAQLQRLHRQRVQPAPELARQRAYRGR